MLAKVSNVSAVVRIIEYRNTIILKLYQRFSNDGK